MMKAPILQKETYYILKIKGKAKIPDYIQIRDKDFTLVGYYRPDRPEKIKKSFGDLEKGEKVYAMIEGMEYGKMEKIEL